MYRVCAKYTIVILHVEDSVVLFIYCIYFPMCSFLLYGRLCYMCIIIACVVHVALLFWIYSVPHKNRRNGDRGPKRSMAR
jgi:hypothetical protein